MGGAGQAQPTYLQTAPLPPSLSSEVQNPQNFPFIFFKIPRVRFFLKGIGKFFGF
jgi:hypothetical protein